jgi:hypothetical protein
MCWVLVSAAVVPVPAAAERPHIAVMDVIKRDSFISTMLIVPFSLSSCGKESM